MSDTGASAPVVNADAATSAFVAAHGGSVYVWSSPAGLKEVSTRPPSHHESAFAEFAGPGFTLFVEDDVLLPKRFDVVLRHFPHHHLDVLWDGRQPGIAMIGAP